MSHFNQKLYQSTQLRQEMRINPRLYQAMELLYMPLLDLQQHLKTELEENPLLEMDEAETEMEIELQEDTKDEPLGDDVDWEEILLDGFEVGGRKEQHEHRDHYEPTPVDVRDLTTTSPTNCASCRSLNGLFDSVKRSLETSTTTVCSHARLTRSCQGSTPG